MYPNKIHRPVASLNQHNLDTFHAFNTEQCGTVTSLLEDEDVRRQ